MLISVIIPCYNEELVIKQTYKRCCDALDKANIEFELIFVNDGSIDNTFDILSDLASSNSSVKIIDFSRNFGHQCAVTAGINNCNGDIAAIIDADLQDPPEAIIGMLNVMIYEKANVVYGVRKTRKGESRFKLATAKCFYRVLNKLSDVKFPVDAGDFRLIDKKIIDQFNSLTEKNKYIRGLISWLGYKQVPYYYEREKRFAGETKYPLSKMIKFAMTGLLYFSTKPLQISTFVGMCSIVLSFIYAFIIIILKIFSTTFFVTGWTSLIIIVIFFGGVQLLTIGVLGLYISNLFNEVKDRPEYIIGEKINF